MLCYRCKSKNSCLRFRFYDIYKINVDECLFYKKRGVKNGR